MALKLRYYCIECLDRRESEIIYNSEGKLYVKALSMSVVPLSEYHFTLGQPIKCPICGKEIRDYKIIRDRPERYVGKDGKIHTREFKDME